MSNWQSTESPRLSTGGRKITRRVLLIAVILAPVAACGKKGALELPAAEPFEEGPDPMEDPGTYGDPMTFPEPGEDEESAE